MKKTHPHHPAALALALLFGLCLGGAPAQAPAQAQVQETYEAPIVFGERQITLTPAELETLGSDPTPFGVELATLMVVDARANGLGIVSRAGRSGVDTSRAGSFLQDPAFQARIQPYIGQPMSFRLISEIQREITQYHRDNNRPLVSVTIPPQEVSDAGLQINVVPFTLGEVRAEGTSRTPPEAITGQVRVARGEVIDTARLIDDINWLNLNPFRPVSSIFSPGDAFGESDLILRVEEKRPWAAYIGASNTGNDSTYEERIFAGANAVLAPGTDLQLSYLFTAAPKNIERGALVENGDSKGYLSHSLAAFLPISTAAGQRYKLTFQGNFVDRFNDNGGIFTSREETWNTSAELAIPTGYQSNGPWSSSAEYYARAQFSQLDTERFFAGLSFDDRRSESRKIAIGTRRHYSGALTNWPVRGHYDVSLVYGEGKVEGFGTNDFLYLQFSGENLAAFPQGGALRLRYAGQWTGDDLGTLDQLGVGGAFSVRGYETNAFAGDSAVWASLELQAKPILLTGSAVNLSLLPYVFADMGFVDSSAASSSQDLASLGAGLRLAATGRAEMTLELARTLEPAVPGTGNDTRVHFNVIARF